MEGTFWDIKVKYTVKATGIEKCRIYMVLSPTMILAIKLATYRCRTSGGSGRKNFEVVHAFRSIADEFIE